ncbi:MAG: tRNA-dihydrouridine synthase, partial [Burkholderiaceae bacterium]
AIKAEVSVPVVANGDIDSPQAAQAVLRATGADAVMIGRAAQGRPWLFREIQHDLLTGQTLAPPTAQELQHWMTEHLQDHYALYGEYAGVRSARKHIGWYARNLPNGDALRRAFNQLESANAQLQALADHFERWAQPLPLAA